MTPEELKAKLEAMEQKNSDLEAKNADLEGKVSEKQTAIDNLDASVKALDGELKELKAKAVATAPKEWKAWLRGQFEKHKSDLEAAWKNGNKGKAIQFKTDPAAMGSGNVTPNNWYGAALDPTINAAPVPANAFLAAFGQRPCAGSRLGWIEAAGNAANAVGYVAELAQNTNLIDFTFSEKTRGYAKLAAKLQMSTEFEDWYEALYDWCVNEGQRLIEAKFDDEVFNGDGADEGHPSDIYGLKGIATAFSALGGTTNANEADVIADARLQIAKAGFNANVAIVSWKEYAVIRELKDLQGHNLFNEVLGMLNGIRIFPSTHINNGEMLIADNSVVAVYGGGNSYELEIVRNADYDRNDVYFRKRCQVKVATTNAKALVYVASVAAAIAALERGGSNGGDTI